MVLIDAAKITLTLYVCQELTGERGFFPDKLYKNSINPILSLFYFVAPITLTTQRYFCYTLVSSDSTLVDANVKPS